MGSVNAEAGVLFLVLFLWQLPHFLAIPWLYRADYARAGLRMLPAIDPDGGVIGRLMIGYCLALLVVSLTPPVIGRAGYVYLAGALLLGIGYLACAVGFARQRSPSRARLVLRASLIYLPAVLTLLILDRMPH